MFGLSGMQVLLAFVLGLPPGTVSKQAEVAAKRVWGAENVQSKIDGRRCRGLLDDPATGLRWRRESGISGGPAKLVRNFDAVSCGGRLGATANAGRDSGPLVQPDNWVVRRGDLLLVLQDSNVVHAELSAVAMRSGATGESIDVRLQFAAKVVRARITGPGRAFLIVEKGAAQR